ncbi:CD276 antigen-like [Protopterus annectens]|uniref:CD276 antigen-like n=1 Tax=Protopterus annectens TaxID=7888 RepID=UPI001CFBA235|nr:CD276 antigen-like [Protopterus annectens]
MSLYVLLTSYGFITAVMGVDYVHILNSVMEADITENVVLSCAFKIIKLDTWNSLRIHWHKVGRDKIIVVHSYYNGGDKLDDQDMEYKDRTQLFHDDLLYGNASLKLLNVKLSDAGNYRCIVADDTGTGYDDGTLRVHAKPSVPVITVLHQDSRVMLYCDTKSIDPHPQVTWHCGKTDQVKYVNITNNSITSEGLFAIQSSLLWEGNIQGNVCCSVTSVDTAQPLQTCTVIPGNSKDKKHKYVFIISIVISAFLLCFSISLVIKLCIYCWKEHLCYQSSDSEIKAIRKQISKTNGQQITIKVIGLISHGAPSLINSCYNVYKNKKIMINVAKCGENLNRHRFFQRPIPLTKSIAMIRERPMMAGDGHFWSKNKGVYMQQWKQNMEDEMLVFIFVVRGDEAITAVMKNEMLHLLSDIKELTGNYPIAVVTRKSLGNLKQATSVLQEIGIEQLFEVDNYRITDQRSREKDLIFLKIIKACLNVIDFRNFSIEPEKETFAII